MIIPFKLNRLSNSYQWVKSISNLRVVRGVIFALIIETGFFFSTHNICFGLEITKLISMPRHEGCILCPLFDTLKEILHVDFEKYQRRTKKA